MDNLFYEILYNKRKAMNKYQRAQTYRTKLPRMSYPQGIETAYYKEIRSWLREFTNYVNETLTSSLLESWVDEIKHDEGKTRFIISEVKRDNE